jgi:putative transposase
MLLLCILLSCKSSGRATALQMNAPDTGKLTLRDWPHSPPHRLPEAGTFIVTAGTYQKQSFFNTPLRLTRLTNSLLELVDKHGWQLHAWAVFPNHYHFVGECGEAKRLRELVRELHSRSAKDINREEASEGRKIWFSYWESQITFHRSFLARLNYVHQNAVRHRLVSRASAYTWCSAGWFERRADGAFFRTVSSFPVDRVSVPDDFEVEFAP